MLQYQDNINNIAASKRTWAITVSMAAWCCSWFMSASSKRCSCFAKASSMCTSCVGESVRECAYVFVYLCVCLCVSVCVCACVWACVCACVCLRAWAQMLMCVYDITTISRGLFITASAAQTSHHITSHHITSHHITSHHITSHHITSHHITWCENITLQLLQHTSHHITSHHITSHTTSYHITASATHTSQTHLLLPLHLHQTKVPPSSHPC